MNVKNQFIRLTEMMDENTFAIKLHIFFIRHIKSWFSNINVQPTIWPIINC